jgi:hypothetical protein
VKRKTFWALLLMFVCVSAAGAHTARMTSAVATVSADGAVSVGVTFDVIAYALNDTSERIGDDAMNALLDGPPSELQAALADASDRLLHAAHLAPGTVTSVSFPTLADVQGYLKTDPHPRLPVILTATLRGQVPADATTFSVRLPEMLGTVVLTVERPDAEPAATASDPGRWSEPVPIHLSAQGGGGDTAGAAVPSFTITTFEFIRLGFEHILPRGLDHILFVLGLFLLSTRVRPLLLQVTAFTLAHSITLALSLYGIFRLPPAVVEPLIAASITFVAVENLFTTKLNPWRPFVVFFFGLVHGLGFSAALTDLHLPRGSFLPALIGFNAGVEMGQLAVLLLAFVAVGAFRGKSWYRPAVAVPASLLIAATGLFWTIQRIVAP